MLIVEQLSYSHAQDIMALYLLFYRQFQNICWSVPCLAFELGLSHRAICCVLFVVCASMFCLRVLFVKLRYASPISVHCVTMSLRCRPSFFPLFLCLPEQMIHRQNSRIDSDCSEAIQSVPLSFLLEPLSSLVGCCPPGPLSLCTDAIILLVFGFRFALSQYLYSLAYEAGCVLVFFSFVFSWSDTFVFLLQLIIFTVIRID